MESLENIILSLIHNTTNEGQDQVCFLGIILFELFVKYIVLYVSLILKYFELNPRGFDSNRHFIICHISQLILIVILIFSNLSLDCRMKLID